MLHQLFHRRWVSQNFLAGYVVGEVTRRRLMTPSMAALKNWTLFYDSRKKKKSFGDTHILYYHCGFHENWVEVRIQCQGFIWRQKTGYVRLLREMLTPQNIQKVNLNSWNCNSSSPSPLPPPPPPKINK